jgi:hypothetical protein
MRFEVLMVMKLSVVVLWVVMPRGLQVGANVVDEHATSIFSLEVHVVSQHRRPPWKVIHLVY